MGRTKQVTKHIQAFDRMLYCERDKEGKLCIYRNSHRVDRFDHEGVTIGYVRSTPYLIFSLTHNWQTFGEPADWGIEPILSRIKAMDLWNRNLADELINDYEKEEKSRERQFSNTTESFLKEFRRPFAKAFSDVNTASLSKIDSRRKEDRKYGNHK